MLGQWYIQLPSGFKRLRERFFKILTTTVFLNPEDGTDRLSRNVGNKSLLAA